ncbi:MAG: iron-containing redox enzyme family protein [Bacteroidetes bacterium]|nr:iron-containing redox enzyme family protein [Bacteroidota bacterium]
MNQQFRLLEHPFYQQWTRGEISGEQLSCYARSYFDFIKMMPAFWEKAVNGLNAGKGQSVEVIKDERRHIELWREFMSRFEGNDHKGMEDVVNEFMSMSPSKLLGAVHAFEIQQPEVAKSKTEGLLNFYGFAEGETKYFDEHLNEAAHIQFGSRLAEEYADPEEFREGYEEGSKIVYNALDRFLN